MQSDVITDKDLWNGLVNQLGGHPAQLWGWGEVKATHGWRAERLVVRNKEGNAIGGAQLLYKQMPRPLGMFCYVPRGPFCQRENRGAILSEIRRHVKSNAFVVSVEPDWNDFPRIKGWRKARNDILLARTIILDIARTNDELLADMSKKTRQYIRKSEKDGVEVRLLEAGEIDDALSIYKETAKRADFALHDDKYYHDIHRLMGGNSPVYGAFSRGKLVAFLWLAVSESTAFELYGGVTDEGQAVRANYILKWQAIKAMKDRGVTRYDMNGLLNDGVSNFKQGFASSETQLAGTYDYPLSPVYTVWNQLLPAGKKAVRLLKRLKG